MKIDMNTLVSATDLNRNSGQLITRAAAGERLVILNQNKPVAAIVPIDDLQRLVDCDNIPASSQPVSPGPAGGQSGSARSSSAARAVQTALGGVSVSDAYFRQGITLPPVGTPPACPIPAAELQAGDVGMFEDDMAIALGDGSALAAGRVQPIDTVCSGPGFLGWFDPHTPVAR
ncbi:type II toxin-antitoxin system Phd/YefM family antitoxin [Mycolicibacterium palauense]|uniref:type II toxin-antitoxin system Phd/YefM family antitoxin n=1 Tax=Mycolicibacterium palauense TaxID=2034511 RepID=UPI000BFEC625|nr:type II toxin-antitoxin system Phd/YefM family antitoxin [Mycolicibacterium palauense]